MKITVKSTNSAKSAFGILSSFQNFRFQRFNFTQIPLFPASGPATSSFNGLHPKSNFLAMSHLVVAEGVEVNFEPDRAGLSPEQVRAFFRSVTRRYQQVQEIENNQ